jgi:hypothetical protein
MKKFLVQYFLFSFFLFTFFASGFLDSQDGLQYLTISRRLYYDRTAEMPQESFRNDSNIHMSTMKGKDGKIYSITGLGYSLAMIPAVFIEDMFLRATGNKPLAAFPLHNDWPVLLFASMTNAFFGASLVVALYLYMRTLRILHKQALLLSFLSVVATNLFVYTKHSFAHMMFISFLVWAFYFVKVYSLKKKPAYLLLAGIMYGVVVISYNQTFIYSLPAIGVYYLLLSRFRLRKQFITTFFRDLIYGFIGVAPFLITYVLYNRMRLGNAGVDAFVVGAQAQILSLPPAYVIVQGIWGLLFSSGKSIFLFSPLLIILLLFWFKMSKKLRPEIVSFSLLFLTYLWLIGTLLGGEDFLVWHGDSSWGPRYMAVTIPFLMLIISTIYPKLSNKEKLFVFYPLVLVSMWINIVGVLLPYQIRFSGLQTDVYFNGRNFNVYEYANLLPRYSPVLSQSKTLIYRLKRIKRVLSHGEYNVRLIDGFDHPFDLGWMVWRGVKPLSVISFDQNSKRPIDRVSVQLKNHQIDPMSSQSAQLAFSLNGKKLHPDKESSLAIEEEKEFIFTLSEADLKPQNNLLKTEITHESTTAAYLKDKQVLFLQIFRINDLPQNIYTMDYPYVSPISSKLLNIEYGFWGGLEKRPWEMWHMHSRMYEQTFDLWWLRPFHYWDLPKKFFFGLFSLNCLALIWFGKQVLSSRNKKL